MKVLVATRQTQGAVPGDYFCTVEGELVTPLPVECCDPDRCGCARGFPGLASDRATTTAMVVERPDLTESQLEMAMRDSLERGGWFCGLNEAERDDLVAEHLDLLGFVVHLFDDGTVIGRHGDHVLSRT